MLDATGKKLVNLLPNSASAEIRSAAALVVGEIGLRDKDAVTHLLALFDDSDEATRRRAMAAIGKLRVESALPRLLDRVAQGGGEADVAAQAAAQVGPKGAKALRDLMGNVAPGLRPRIAAALAASGTITDSPTGVLALLDGDHSVVNAAVRTLSAEIPSLSARHREALADNLFELLGPPQKRSSLPAASETAIIRLLGALHDIRAEPMLWERTQPPHPPELRAAALQALGPRVGTPSKDQLHKILACAAEADFRVAAPASLILKGLRVSPSLFSAWLTLFDAPDPAVRRLAIEKIGDSDRAEVAQGLLKQLGHGDRILRDEAIARLGRIDQGRRALAEALCEAHSVDQAWVVARALTPFASQVDPVLRKKLMTQALRYLEKGDRRADPLLAALKAADAAALRTALEKHAESQRKKKKYDTAIIFLRLLARDPACGAPLRMELAACNLKVSARDVNPEARAADPALQHFAALLTGFPEETTDFVRKAKWLDPDDLFYLGFHFAEKERREKQFGGDVLKLVIARTKGKKIGKDAKSKLRGEGLD
jgi:HEAT repeat protein